VIKRHYVYVHRKITDGAIFYVGKGSRPDRMLDQTSRSRYWHNVVKKHGFSAEGVARFETDDLSQQLERDLIAWYGRANLANLTDGGDGCAGISPSKAARSKLSELAKRKRTDAWVQSIRRARKNGGNGGVVKIGDKLPDSWRASIAKTKIGELNPMFGKTGEKHHNSRKVIDKASGTVFPSMTAAANSLGMKVGTLHNMLVGTNHNRTTLELA
jgi:hypothetical protein